MKYLLMLFIRLYWLIPKSWRRHCLFQQSCSEYVYAAAQQRGVLAGFSAFLERFRQCRGNYAILEIAGNEYVVLNDKTLIEREKMRI